MADDFAAFYAHAGRTLSIALEVYEVLKECEHGASDKALTRLELEAATWDKNIEDHAAYKLKKAEYTARTAAWNHAHAGEKPEKPACPPSLPDSIELPYLFQCIADLKTRAVRFRKATPGNSGTYSIESELTSIVHLLGSLANAIEYVKSDLAFRANEYRAPDAAQLLAKLRDNQTLPVEVGSDKGPEMKPPGSVEPQGYVTVEELAKLAGVTIGTIKNRLSEERPSVKPIKSGGRNRDAYPWPGIRSWMMDRWPLRPFPENFQKLQEHIRDNPA